MYRTQDLHVKEIVPLLSPRALKALSPTPEAVNVAKTLGSVNSLRVNEWMAAPAYGDFALSSQDSV